MKGKLVFTIITGPIEDALTLKATAMKSVHLQTAKNRIVISPITKFNRFIIQLDIKPNSARAILTNH